MIKKKLKADNLDAGVVFLVIERAERELEAKLVLGKMLVKNGFGLVVGSREKLLDVLRVGYLKNRQFIWIDKSCPAYMTANHAYIKRRGGRIVILEEEAWSPFTIEDLIERRFSSKGIELVDEIWCSTQSMYQAMNSDSRFSNKVVRYTSHPRIDCLLLSAEQSVRLAESKVITFMSTYGLLNPGLDAVAVLHKEAGGSSKVNYHQCLDQFRLNYQLFCNLLKKSKLLEGWKVILRLHPAEVGMYSSQFLKEIGSYVSISGNTYNEDLKNSQFLIHTGSTVAVDAIAHNVQTICLQDERSIVHSDMFNVSDYRIKVDPDGLDGAISSIKNIIENKNTDFISSKKSIYDKFILPEGYGTKLRVDLRPKATVTILSGVLSHIRRIKLVLSGKRTDLQVLNKKQKLLKQQVDVLTLTNGKRNEIQFFI